ncbi:MAG TPA: alanine/ornithine racemase family PLP-dependent enzyme [Motiliproteus sp.]
MVTPPAPRLEIDLAKIRHNTTQLVQRLGSAGVSVTGVTKGVCGDPAVARAMLQGGVHYLGDSRLENISRLRAAGLGATFVLLRSPQLSRVAEVVASVDISLNSEIEVITRLSQAAVAQRRQHRVLLMVEQGDLREGLQEADLDAAIERCRALPNIVLEGIGTNLTCLNGIKPDRGKMTQLSRIATRIRRRYGLPLATVSGGNSSTLDWLLSSDDPLAINNLRLGEAILLGRETLYQAPLHGLYQDAITLVCEVIEAQHKQGSPSGDRVPNAFGEILAIQTKGQMLRAVLGIGQQDVPSHALHPQDQRLQIVGATSDHLVLDASAAPLAVGDEVRFQLSYSGLLATMTSPFVSKHLLNAHGAQPHQPMPALPTTTTALPGTR